MQVMLPAEPSAVTVFTARCYASAVFAVIVCPSVCLSVRLSQAGVLSKRLDASSWYLAWRLPSIYPKLCFKEIWISPEIRVLPDGNLSQTSDLENFVAASRSRCQRNSSSSSSMVEFVDDTYTTVDESWMFTTSRSTVTLQLHSICCGFVVQLVSTVEKID